MIRTIMISDRIAFISVNQYKVPYPVYPLGISYLATGLRETGRYEVMVIDMNMTDHGDCIRRLREFDPAYIGISLRNIDDVNFYNKENFIFGYKRLIDDIRSSLGSTILLGGAGFSLYPEVLVDFLRPDYAMAGEGEKTILALLDSLREGKDPSGISGLVYRRGNTITVNDRTKPCPHNDFPVRYESGLVPYYWKNSGMLNLQTKRGCPFRCIYCTYPLIEGNTVRTNNIDRVIESLEDLSVNHGVDYVFFTDSVFNIDRKYNIELAKRIISSGIRMRWGGYFAPTNLDDEEMSLLKESGLTHIEFGTESLSDTVLCAYRKGFTVEDVIRSSELCNKYGVNFVHFMILGGYGETEKTLAETFENSKRIENTAFFPFVGMRIYPNTELHRIALDEGIVSETDQLLDPVYYVAKGINLDTIQKRAKATGGKWFFPDEDFSAAIGKMRARNKKGLLWEYLIRF